MDKTSPKMFKIRSRAGTSPHELTKNEKKKLQLYDYLMDSFKQTGDVKKTISLAKKALICIEEQPLQTYLMAVSTTFKNRFI